ncbi:MAG: hypothetical protein KTR31_32060 [Myxococcales bacterium]|nr:hypothetical protein [Myxococcales bacterium]
MAISMACGDGPAALFDQLWDETLLAEFLGEFSDGAGPGDGHPVDHQAQSALTDITELSNDRGFGAIVRALPSDHPLWRAVPSSPPHDLALALWLGDRTLFRRIHATHGLGQPQPFREFYGRQPQPHAAVDDALDQGVAADLGAGFARAGHGGRCRVRSHTTSSGGYLFEIRRGSPRRRRTAVVEGASRARLLTYRPERVERVFFEPSSGLLRIASRHADTIRLVRAVLGTHLHDDPDWFSIRQVLSLAPLTNQGATALRPVPGLARVSLRELEIELPHQPPHATLVLRASDVLGLMDRYGRVDIRDGRPVYARFALHPTGGGCPSTVHLRLHNRVSYDWRRHEDTTNRFLTDRGFRLPAAQARAAARAA